MKGKKSAVFLLMMVFFMPVCTAAKQLIFVTGGMSPPLVFEENNEIRGMDVDVIAEFCKRNAVEPKFEVYPWKRSLKNIEEGSADAIFTLFRTEEREKIMYFPSVPINTVKTSVWAKKERGIKISSLADLKDKSIGVLTEYKYGKEFDSLQGLSKTFCTDKEQLLKMLDRNRFDAAIDSEACFRFMCRKFGLDEDKFELVHVITENPVYVGFSKKKMGPEGELLAEKFSRFMEQLEAEGALQKIRDQYAK
ncbi:MAG: transporter substrate-binding domain-containing protein [Desulfobacterales bacterium]